MKHSDSKSSSSPETLYSSCFDEVYDVEKGKIVEKTSEAEVETSNSIFSLIDVHDSPLLIIGCITMLISSSAKPIQTVIYGRIFEQISDFLSNNYKDKGTFLSNIGFYCGLIVIVGLVNLIFLWLGIFSWMMFGERQQDKARTRIMKKVLAQKLEWFDRKENIEGELNQVNRCIEELRSGSSELLGLIVKNIGVIIASFVTSMYHSWNLTLVVISGAPVMAFLGWLFGVWTYKLAKVENNMSSKAAKILDWSCTSSIIVRCYNGKYMDSSRFGQYVGQSGKSYFKMARVIAANVGILRCLVLLMFVQGFWYGNHMISISKLHINQVFTCFTSCLILGSSVSELLSLLATLNKAQAAINDINTFLKKTDNEFDKDMDTPSSRLGDIVVDGVEFAYSTRDAKIISGLSFSVKPKEMNFIIGQSGSGKSTLAKLIMGFYSPTRGKITIDGYEISRLHPHYLSSILNYVEHDAYLFDCDVETNIKLAAMSEFTSMNDVPESRFKEALSFAFFDHKRISDDGNNSKPNLSGGQRQKVALARARIKDSPILILDEPFSNLDNKTKSHIYTKLRKWRMGKTTIIITHDLDLLNSCDNVLEIQKGEVVYQGVAGNRYSQNIKGWDKAHYSKHYSSITELNKIQKLNSGLLKDPVILRGLEKLNKVNPDDIKLLPIFSIIKHWFLFGKTKFKILFGAFIAVLSGLTGPVFSFCFSKLLSNMVDSSIARDNNSALVKWSLVVIGVSISDGLTHFISQSVLYCAAEEYILKMRNEIFYKINEQDMSFFNGGGFTCSTLTTLLMNDSRDNRNLLSEFSLIGINFVSLTLVGIVWAIVSGWKLALVGLAFVPLILFITGAYSKILEKTESEYKSKVAESERYLHDVVKGMKEIRNLGIDRFAYSEFISKLEIVNNYGLKRAISTGFGLSLNEFCNSGAIGVILYYGIKLIKMDEYNYRTFLQVSTLLSFTLANSAVLLNSLPDITRGQRSGTLLIELLNLSSSKSETSGSLIPSRCSNTVLIKTSNLYFRHSGESDYILQNINLSVNKDEVLAIAGASGCGKSTLASLFVKLFEITDNSIFVYNQDVNTISTEWLRENFVLITQSPSFFEGTVYENLVYGLEPHKISQSWMEQCLQLTNLFDFIHNLPGGLDVRMSEGSDSLFSTGQLQRLAIVRALLRRPRCLIFDESTSNLDINNINIVRNLIKSRQLIRPDISIIIISHQRIMLELASKVLVLKNGVISQEGNFNALYESGRELYRILNCE